MTIKAIYFSPTRTTEKVVMKIANKITMKLKTELDDINITKIKTQKVPDFSKEDVLILGLPVYAGRIPEIVEDYVFDLKGNGTKAIVIALYGNRDYDDALVEMRDILDSRGFEIIAAGAFIGEHSFTKKVATDRPDKEDLKEAEAFGDSIAVKFEDIGNSAIDSIEVRGNRPYKERSALPQVAPSTNDKCNECMDCAEACPTGTISMNNPKEADVKKCILCCKCIKICPESAKFNADESILGLTKMLEDNFSKRRDPELFI